MSCLPRRARASTPRLPWLCETVLDAFVVLMATWTVVYHLCLALRLSAPWAVSFELGALAVCAVLWRRLHPRSIDGAEEREPAPLARDATTMQKALLATVVVAGATTAALVAVDGPWTVVWGLWLTAAVAGTIFSVVRLRRSAGAEPAKRWADSRTTSTGVVAAVCWATMLAVLSMFARRPNADDLYYVNLSQWVVDHGTFPVRDTIFSDLAFPMSSWPPVASYDGLAGTLALLSGVRAASVVYVVVPPVVTFLSVLALWRLLQEWRVRAVGTALSLALLFLLFDGGPGYAAPGNLFLTRIWQGKVMLLAVGVPTLLVLALRYVGQPSAVRAGWLFGGGVAATGLSTSAMFLVPLLALAGAAPLAVSRPGRALTGFTAMAAYPLAAGGVTLALGGRSADFFASRNLYRFDPAWFGPEIFRSGPVAAIAVAAVLFGALIVPRNAARVIAGVAAVMVGVTLVPGMTQLSFALVGLGPTLWRVSWITPIAAFVGALAVQLGSDRGPGSYSNRRGIRMGVPLAVAVVLIVSGLPIWSARNGVVLDSSPQWKLDDVVSAQRAIDAAHPGDVILAPQALAVTITVLTTEVKTVAPRDYFMDYLRADPSFRYDQRQTLLAFVDEESVSPDASAVVRALRMVGVDQVCLPLQSDPQARLLRAEGYEQVTGSPTHRCYARRPASGLYAGTATGGRAPVDRRP